jgi:Asp-tRNA(Asn)/Glu-tRNA(Gln) amidotransferase B subunit
MSRLTPNTIWNSSWNGLHTEKQAKQSADKLTKAIEKVERTAAKAIEVSKAGSKQVVDALGKIKATNNSEESISPLPTAPVPTALTPGTRMLHDGLKGIAATTSEIADDIIARPKEMRAAVDSATAISKQYADLVASASRTVDESEQMQRAAGEAAKASQWIGDNLGGGCSQCASICNSSGRVVGSFDELLGG